jgi:hypothetical protein
MSRERNLLTASLGEAEAHEKNVSLANDTKEERQKSREIAACFFACSFRSFVALRVIASAYLALKPP